MINPSLDIQPGFLTPLLEEIANEWGIELALSLVEHYGGCRIYIPKNWTQDHELNILGEDNAKAIFKQYGGEELNIPLRPFSSEGLTKMVEKLRRENKLHREIALSLGVGMTTVRLILQGKGTLSGKRNKTHCIKDQRQIDLEDWLNVPETSEHKKTA